MITPEIIKPMMLGMLMRLSITGAINMIKRISENISTGLLRGR